MRLSRRASCRAKTDGPETVAAHRSSAAHRKLPRRKNSRTAEFPRSHFLPRTKVYGTELPDLPRSLYLPRSLRLPRSLFLFGYRLLGIGSRTEDVGPAAKPIFGSRADNQQLRAEPYWTPRLMLGNVK